MPAKLRHVAAGDLDAAVAALDADGAVVVDGFLDGDSLSRFNEDIGPYLSAADPAMEHVNPLLGAFFGDRTRRVGRLAERSDVFVDVLVDPLLLGVCDHLLLPACASYVMNLGHVLDVGPGATDQMLHRDEDVWVHVPRPAPVFEVASMCALVDFTSKNGATRVVPGSHRWSADREAEADEVVSAEMAAGSVVVYTGRTLHGAGANTTTDAWRRGLHLSYLVGWLRTEENNTLATPPEVARRLPPQAQALIGYAVHDAIEDAGGVAGMLEWRDPMETLAEGAPLA